MVGVAEAGLARTPPDNRFMPGTGDNVKTVAPKRIHWNQLPGFSGISAVADENVSGGSWRNTCFADIVLDDCFGTRYFRCFLSEFYVGDFEPSRIGAMTAYCSDAYR